MKTIKICQLLVLITSPLCCSTTFGIQKKLKSFFSGKIFGEHEKSTLNDLIKENNSDFKYKLSASSDYNYWQGEQQELKFRLNFNEHYLKTTIKNKTCEVESNLGHTDSDKQKVCKEAFTLLKKLENNSSSKFFSPSTIKKIFMSKFSSYHSTEIITEGLDENEEGGLKGQASLLLMTKKQIFEDLAKNIIIKKDAFIKN